MKECKTPGVPGFRALRSWQAQRAQMMGFQTTHHTTALNNEYYANHPAELFRFNLANPLIRPLMHLYPEVTGPISEFFQANKMLGMDSASLDQSQLMWADWKGSPQRHFYIKELAQLKNGNFVIPLKWITVSGIESFDGYAVTYDKTNKVFAVDCEHLVRVVATSLWKNCLDLKAQGHVFLFSGAAPEWVANMPHPVRQIAKSKPTITVTMMPWSDDVSGNKTKQYNAHTNVYIANTSIPHAKLQQEYFIQFVSTSQYASSSEQMQVIAEHTGPEKWFTAYDCILKQEVLFRIIPHILPADNPQQAEHCSHMTGKGSRPCRRCEVGGSAAECEEDEGYEEFFSGGTERTTASTVSAIRGQLLAACLGVQDGVDQLQTKTGIKDKIAQFWIEQLIPKARELQNARMSEDARLRDASVKGDERKAMKDAIKIDIQRELFQWLIEQPERTYRNIPEASELRRDIRPGDHYNPLLSIPSINVHRDTPCEILHTYLLGVDKYVWHKTNSEWDKKNEQLFAVRLRASSINGLTQLLTLTSMLDDFIIQYPNSLLGKHFKILQQLAVFHLYDGVCPPVIFDLWKATGELGAVLWFHKIDNLDLYLADLETYIANVLDIWAILDPNRILVKLKLHVLAHLVDDIRRHGPAVLYSTEIFECWNAIFRLCSIYSNHHGPSHDIAGRMASLEQFKHQVSGGWWRSLTGSESSGSAAPGPQILEAPTDSDARDDGTNAGAMDPLPEYVRAGEKVRTFLQCNPTLQRRLGWVSPSVLVAGTVKLMAKDKQAPSEWIVARGQKEIPIPEALSSPQCTWYHCKYLVAQSRDICKPDSWIFFRNQKGIARVGRISKILSCPEEGRAVAIIDKYDIDHERDTYFNMPVIHRICDPEGRGQSTHIPVESVIFIFNAQHHCRACGCTRQEDQQILQERKLTGRTRKIIGHEPIGRYLLNMHALHNAALIREVLPRELTSPIPYVDDREARHRELAAAMRISGPRKRADAQAKAAETRARNKNAKQGG
ncbi:uncharacterized protein TRAVEDRAFT_60724 [Trametes versicolor FP-101664 SS1]|uniref:uncharacterized protein n=1 Tax=Trametes versicolor (strain FP-101664) TaxID=717944 RepID=UPI00046243DD|nr:uncharacterized protein TRAVEDRAFT_60724 [Trametes versicolor FP-101664 SS1]EIW54556.1 hypothetical protein TRAVEDRAFT_60724 [Trametes versicolor FP-101664 SS1]